MAYKATITVTLECDDYDGVKDLTSIIETAGAYIADELSVDVEAEEL